MVDLGFESTILMIIIISLFYDDTINDSIHKNTADMLNYNKELHILRWRLLLRCPRPGRQDGGPRLRGLRQARAAPPHAPDREFAKGGFSKGGFCSLCVIVVLLLLDPPLLDPPLWTPDPRFRKPRGSIRNCNLTDVNRSSNLIFQPVFEDYVRRTPPNLRLVGRP